MIVAIRTPESETLEKFKVNFLEPKSIWKQFIHSFAYTSKKITKINDITIFYMESFIDVFAKYSLLFGVIGIIASMYFNLTTLLIISIFSLLISMFVLSRVVRGYLIKMALRTGGHKDKIEFLSNTELLEEFLFQLEE